MIAFRHADPRFPFLREDSAQPAGRWNAAGEPTHYFYDTPDGAWAEFLRHEEIDDPRDMLTIRRALWAVEIGEPPSLTPDLPSDVLFGGPQSWSACTRFAREHRPVANGITAPSAALHPGDYDGTIAGAPTIELVRDLLPWNVAGARLQREHSLTPESLEPKGRFGSPEAAHVNGVEIMNDQVANVDVPGNRFHALRVLTESAEQTRRRMATRDHPSRPIKHILVKV